MKNLATLSTLLAATLLVACGTSPRPTTTTMKTVQTTQTRVPVAPPAPAPLPAPEPEVAASSCPLPIPGVTISSENTHMGAAIVFIGSGDPAGLRSEVVDMAAAHNRVHAAIGPLPGTAPAETVTVVEPARDDGPIPVPDEPTAGEGEGEDGQDGLMNPFDEGEAEGEDETLASGGTRTVSAADAPSEADRDLTIIHVHSRARADEGVEKGARLVFVSDTDDIDALREEVREAASDLREACSIVDPGVGSDEPGNMSMRSNAPGAVDDDDAAAPDEAMAPDDDASADVEAAPEIETDPGLSPSEVEADPEPGLVPEEPAPAEDLE
jgi:hypothetical protein